ncbi:MAG: hypothetical protein IPM29_00150 [Planctomycetes bacterium]|nr:hypothetical protein [Planctomycetota bacterium]
MSSMVRTLFASLVVSASLFAQNVRPLAMQGWQFPARATVTQEGTKKGHEVTLRYRIELSQLESGELRLRYSEFELLAVDGTDFTDPRLAKQARRLLASLITAYPELRISAEGLYLGVHDWEGTVPRMIDTLRKLDPEADPEVLRATREMMLDPSFGPTVELACGNDWGAWLGCWVGLEIKPNSSFETTASLPIGDREVEAAVTFRHRGESGDGHVRLESTTLISGTEAEAAMIAMLRRISNRTGRAFPSEAELQLQEFSKRTSLSVITDPDTLRPREASSEERSVLHIQGQRREQVERARYRFEWDEPRR